MTKDLKSSLAWGGGIIAVALAATLARRTGVIDADAVTRIVLGVIGLMVAWYGNRMPKTFAPNEISRQVTCKEYVDHNLVVDVTEKIFCWR